MQYTNTNETYILKIEKGERVVRAITHFCKEEEISNASFTGIGAVDWLRCGYYALNEKQYHFTEYMDMVEVASLIGNVMLKDSAPFVHMHGVFTGTTNAAFGGHIEEMRVGVTLEVVLHRFDTAIARTYDEAIGLYLCDHS